MNKELLNTGVQNFIFENLNTDIVSVLLKNSPFDGVSTKELAQQIASKQKCRTKLPTWFSSTNIYYPTTLNIEQTSSETTAKYKSQIVSGKLLLDVTGGFGVDSHFFAKKVGAVHHCEVDKNLSEIAAHNSKILGVENIIFRPQNGLHFLEESTLVFDWVFIDPSRRNEAKGKVFFLADCHPNIPEHLELLFKKCNHILVKTSPLLDFSIGIKELKFVKEIHVVAINNEVKELLWVMEKKYEGSIAIKTVNIKKTTEELFDFTMGDEKEAISNYSTPLEYLYEPNAAILKSGAFKTVGNRYKLKKIHEHTHLYTSNELMDFPGRRFRIASVHAYQKKILQKLGVKKANISTRNFPEPVAAIRKRLKIKDGGDIYLFFTKNIDNQLIMIKCMKID